DRINVVARDRTHGDDPRDCPRCVILRLLDHADALEGRIVELDTYAETLRVANQDLGRQRNDWNEERREMTVVIAALQGPGDAQRLHERAMTAEAERDAATAREARLREALKGDRCCCGSTTCGRWRQQQAALEGE